METSCLVILVVTFKIYTFNRGYALQQIPIVTINRFDEFLDNQLNGF